MSYGAQSYGSASIAGLSVSQSAFYDLGETLAIGVHRRTREYTGNAEFFAILWHMENLIEGQHELRIYSHNDPGETPQLQTTIGPSFDSQRIISAARFIVAELALSVARTRIDVTISGQEYFQ